MKRLLFVLLPAVLAGVLAFAVCYHFATRPARNMAQRSDHAVSWLAQEFGLSSEQAVRVDALHKTYEAHCEEMCGKIEASHKRLNALILTNRTLTPEIEAELQECAKIQKECRMAMLTQIYEVAAAMPQDQRERYLMMMKGRVLSPGMPHTPETSLDQHP